ncbi:MobF family relaxase [Streptomyces barkulensis]|uniref:MobF family relaxase n=1 Tax=Streptomyces barkulensis TaxID=1257026 RepID=UPI0023F8E797|nr:MobF family relaxase [Streptomyces barkulensis]
MGMTVKGITAKGHSYYQRNIAAGDGARGSEPTTSSSVPGVPPGEWHGQAARVLGLAGEVSEPQMNALFGKGLHPDAEAIVDRELARGASLKQAMKAAKLGPALPQLSELSPLDRAVEEVLEYAAGQLCRPLTKAETKDLRMRTAAHAFMAEHHRDPADGAELKRFLATRTGPQRQARTGFDLTFSCEELSILFALGSPEVRQVALEVLKQARAETVAWLENSALAVRTGPGGVTQQRAEPGLLATVYLHYESRAGDPMLHEHVVISPRVQGPDGRWRNLDSRLLYREVVAASELFNQRALELLCARLGLATETVEATPEKKPVMQIAGIDPRIRALFAQRATAVRTMADRLLTDHRHRHGREPNTSMRIRLQGQATLMTRPAKRTARSLDELLASWRSRAITSTDRATVDHLLATAQAAASRRAPAADIDPSAAAEEVLAAVSERRTTFHRRHILAEARRHLMRTLGGTTASPQMADAITDQALAHADCLDITPPQLNPPYPEPVPSGSTGTHRPIGSTTYTTRSLLAAENRLLAATRTRVIPPVAHSTFHRVAALHRGPLDTRQRALARSFALSDQLLLAGLGPAGAGKTTAMKLVAAAADAAGSTLIPLAPSARAAQALGQDLGQRAHTLHAWLHQRQQATNGRQTAKNGFRLRRGDIVLIDEAGMAGTRLLDAVLADAAAAGAVVRLLGDVHQLAAVEAGGALRLIARAGGAVELDRLHRFRTPGEADASLLLRDSDTPQEAFTWYRNKGRVTAGSHRAMRDAVFTGWQRDTARGRTALMTAADHTAVADLNTRAQAHRIATGAVDPRQATALRAGARAHVGDVIVTRLNRRRMTVRGGKDFVKNGDTWTVEKILPGGDAVIRHTTHRGRIRLPADYLADHGELGYASTAHRAQGMTVDTSHALATPASTREGVYVQLTRGARTNRLYVALDDGDRLDDVLTTIAARRRTHLSATETIAALQQAVAAPGQLAAEFADASERATTARLTGVLEHTLGADRAAAFLAADAYPALTRALADAERAGFDLPRLIDRATASPLNLDGADDPAALLAWRLRHLLADAKRAQTSARHDPLARLSLKRLETMAHLASTHRAAAQEALHAADAATTHLPTPVTTPDGRTHPAWPDRPLGPLTTTELAAQTATARAALRHAQSIGAPLSQTARHTLTDLHHETTLRRALPWRERAREDYQRDQAANNTPADTQPLSATRRTINDRRAATADRLNNAKAALAHADATTARVNAELRLRDTLPDHPPHRPNHHGDIPDWVADRHALVHPATPDHWRTHLAERHRILTRSLKDRGHTLAGHPPAWARPLGPVPPATAPRRRAAWAHTCALVELWRTRRAITAVPGIGPRPDDPDGAAAWEDLAARIRVLRGRSRPARHTPPPDATAAGILAAADAHLNDLPLSGALPDHPAPRDPYGIAPTSHAAHNARLARSALTAVLTGKAMPEPWIEEITAPAKDDETEHRTYTQLITAINDYRRRHQLTTPDILGPRPAGLAGEEWDHLTDAIDLYTRARIERRLEQIRIRTALTRTEPPPSTTPPRKHFQPDPRQPGHQLPGHRRQGLQ